MTKLTNKKPWPTVNVAEAVRKIIIDLRKDHGMTQEELARRLGTDQANISDWERGKVAPSLESLEKIAKVFRKRVRIEMK